MAEEVISTIRTAQAFGTQQVLSSLYDLYVARSCKVDQLAALWHGGGLAVFFFVIYSSYALGQHTCLTPPILTNIFPKHSRSALHSSTADMVSRSITPKESFHSLFFFVASAGAVINVFFSIIIGSFSLALLAPEAQGRKRIYLRRSF